MEALVARTLDAADDVVVGVADRQDDLGVDLTVFGPEVVEFGVRPVFLALTLVAILLERPDLLGEVVREDGAERRVRRGVERRPLIALAVGVPEPAALETVSGRGATIRSNAAPDCGTMVTLVQPAAGEIVDEVHAISKAGIELSFAGDEDSVAFALSAIAADMTQAG